MNLSEKIKAKIKWLRNQPENVKVKYVWISTFVVFAIVALLWAGLFRKYEKKAPDDGKSTELIIDEAKKMKDDIGSKIKIPDIKLPEVLPEASLLILPSVSPEITPEAF